MEQDGLKVEGTVEFNSAGEMVGFHADRYREVRGSFVLTPWSGLMSDWKSIDGHYLPGHWEAKWHLTEGDFSYVQMDILSVTTE